MRLYNVIGKRGVGGGRQKGDLCLPGEEDTKESPYFCSLPVCPSVGVLQKKMIWKDFY